MPTALKINKKTKNKIKPRMPPANTGLRRWTPEQRRAQGEALRARKIWLNSTGPKTEEGKKRAAQNALKHGRDCAQAVRFRRLLRRHRLYLDALRTALRQERAKRLMVLEALRQAGGAQGFIDIIKMPGYDCEARIECKKKQREGKRVNSMDATSSLWLDRLKLNALKGDVNAVHSLGRLGGIHPSLACDIMHSLDDIGTDLAISEIKNIALGSEDNVPAAIDLLKRHNTVSAMSSIRQVVGRYPDFTLYAIESWGENASAEAACAMGGLARDKKEWGGPVIDRLKSMTHSTAVFEISWIGRMHAGLADRAIAALEEMGSELAARQIACVAETHIRFSDHAVRAIGRLREQFDNPSSRDALLIGFDLDRLEHKMKTADAGTAQSFTPP